MHKILKIATILSWVNMIFWGLGCFFLLLAVLASGVFTLAAALIFPSAVVLHSYAAFQLHKSIRNPAIPLSSQTPTGLRFIGYVALFIGVFNLIEGVSIIQNAHELLKQMLIQSPQLKDFNFNAGHVRMIGIISILTGLCVAVNVNLNFRLLRWYNFLKENADKEK